MIMFPSKKVNILPRTSLFTRQSTTASRSPNEDVPLQNLMKQTLKAMT